MPSDETTKQIIGLTRFAVLCSLALVAILLFADLLGRAWNSPRFLTEPVLITFICAIAAEVAAAIVAATCLALWCGEKARGQSIVRGS
jgi:hypothetical protein